MRLPLNRRYWSVLACCVLSGCATFDRPLAQQPAELTAREAKNERLNEDARQRGKSGDAESAQLLSNRVDSGNSNAGRSTTRQAGDSNSDIQQVGNQTRSIAGAPPTLDQMLDELVSLETPAHQAERRAQLESFSPAIIRQIHRESQRAEDMGQLQLGKFEAKASAREQAARNVGQATATKPTAPFSAPDPRQNSHSLASRVSLDAPNTQPLGGVQTPSPSLPVPTLPVPTHLPHAAASHALGGYPPAVPNAGYSATTYSAAGYSAAGYPASGQGSGVSLTGIQPGSGSEVSAFATAPPQLANSLPSVTPARRGEATSVLMISPTKSGSQPGTSNTVAGTQSGIAPVGALELDPRVGRRQPVSPANSSVSSPTGGLPTLGSPTLGAPTLSVPIPHSPALHPAPNTLGVGPLSTDPLPNRAVLPPTETPRGRFPNTLTNPVQNTIQSLRNAAERLPGVRSFAPSGEPLPLPTAASASPSAEVQLLISQLEAQLANAAPGATDADRIEYLRKHVNLRMLYLIADRNDQALEPIRGIDPNEQEFWQQLIWSIAAYFDAQGQPRASDRATQTVAQLRSAIHQLKTQAELELRNVTFCQRIDSYGNFERLSRDQFSPGIPVLLYAEIDNFRSVPAEGDRYMTAIKSTVEFYKSRGDGKKIQSIPFDVSQDYCRNRRRDYFLAYEFTVPQQLEPGTYTLVLNVEDQLGQKTTSAKVNFTIE